MELDLSDTPFPKWRGCTLVNPLCPTDLCVLPKTHKGLHKLHTSPEPEKLSKVLKRAHNRITDPWELVKLGWEKASELWPENFERLP